MTALPLAAAARELGVGPATLKRWVRDGAPVAHRGRPGRGYATLVDVDRVRAWRGAGERDAVLIELATRLPDVLADAMFEAWQRANGVDKRRLAGVMAAGWFVGASKILDVLHELHRDIQPDPRDVPEPIDRLRKIARG